MPIKQYLLDANIVIKLWNEYPKLLEYMEVSQKIDFKISKDISIELSKKEFAKHNGVPILTDKFLKLLNHIIENEVSDLNDYNFNINIKHTANKNIYYVDDNKLSKSDFNLICICKTNEQYTLVTEDKKLLNSAKLLLNSSKVLTFDEFIEEIKMLN